MDFRFKNLRGRIAIDILWSCRFFYTSIRKFWAEINLPTFRNIFSSGIIFHKWITYRSFFLRLKSYLFFSVCKLANAMHDSCCTPLIVGALPHICVASVCKTIVFHGLLKYYSTGIREEIQKSTRRLLRDYCDFRIQEVNFQRKWISSIMH